MRHGEACALDIEQPFGLKDLPLHLPSLFFSSSCGIGKCMEKEKIGQALDILGGRANMTCRCGRVRTEEEYRYADYQIVSFGFWRMFLSN